jgi:hypothetical protein
VLVEPTERRAVTVERSGRALVGAQRFGRGDVAVGGAAGSTAAHPLGRSASVSSRSSALLLTAVLFSPVLAEVVRKYVFWSDAVFLLHYAGLITLLGLLLLRNGAYRLVPQNVFTVACLLVGWTCVQAALTGVPPLALAVGISTYLVPVLALYLSIIAFATTPQKPVIVMYKKKPLAACRGEHAIDVARLAERRRVADVDERGERRGLEALNDYLGPCIIRVIADHDFARWHGLVKHGLDAVQ